MQIIELSEVGGTRSFPIVIGMTEACAIERRRKGCGVERPQTHDLLSNVISELGAKVERIEIVDLKEKVFFARIILRQGSKRIEIDARPSDAVAIGVACNAPMFVAEHVIAQASADAVSTTARPAHDEADADADADAEADAEVDVDDIFNESDESDEADDED